MASEALELSHRPGQERLVDVPDHGSQGRRRVSPIVAPPSSDNGVDLSSDVCQRYLCSTTNVQFPDLGPHGFQRRGTDRAREAAKHFLALRSPHRPWPELISEEVELDDRIRSLVLIILAVHDPRFGAMHLQLTLRQPRLKLSLEGHCFLLCPVLLSSHA